jgi:RNA polymerase sigma-70 factor (ECF subfamily)
VEFTDEALMMRVQQGDSEAYKVLFERHQGRVYGYLLRRTRSPEIAADLYQETFLRLYRARNTWQKGRPVRPWLFGIAVNAAKDHARKVRRLPVEVELSPTLQGEGIRNPVTKMDLEQAIAGLPDHMRDAFLLGAVEGFDHNEVAAQLDISPDNARARISRARAQLRKMLGGEP